MDCKMAVGNVEVAGSSVGGPAPGTRSFVGTELVRLAALVRRWLGQVRFEEFEITCAPCNDEIAVSFGNRPLSAEALAKRTAADYEGPPRRCSACSARLGSMHEDSYSSV
jgi:hypothetical protein